MTNLCHQWPRRCSGRSPSASGSGPWPDGAASWGGPHTPSGEGTFLQEYMRINRRKWRINIITYPRGLRTRSRRAAGAVAWGLFASREGQVPGNPGTFPLAASSPHKHSARAPWIPASSSSAQIPQRDQTEHAWWIFPAPWWRLPPPVWATRGLKKEEKIRAND